MYRIYQCSICGEKYSEEFGDVDAGLTPGTKYEDIPDTWCCPNCGATKASLVRIS